MTPDSDALELKLTLMLKRHNEFALPIIVYEVLALGEITVYKAGGNKSSKVV